VSFWSRIRGWVAKDQDTNRFFWDLIGGSRTTGGVIVTQKNAMRAVWACVMVRAEDTAKLPCIMYRRKKDGERAGDGPSGLSADP
jgi:phage portal protein BeeE